MLGLIREDKRQRIMRLVSKSAADSVLTGEILAMTAIKNEFGIPIKDQVILSDRMGKLYLSGHPEVNFNISHSGKYVVCALCDRVVGVDIQEITPCRWPVAKRFFTPAEIEATVLGGDIAFTKIWTRKEAYLKMLGTGFTRLDFSGIEDCDIETMVYENAALSVAVR